MLSAALEVENLDLSFDGGFCLSGLGFHLPQGGKLTLRGPSGCGKSSVLKCLAGLMRPQRGVIRVFGDVLHEKSVWALRRKMAYVQQQDPFPGLQSSVREALESVFAYQANRALRGNLQRVPEWMDRLHLGPGLLDKALKTLSGGEKQRMGLVAALLLDRPLLLLDEATSGLDPDNRERMHRLIRESEHLSVVAVSHDEGPPGIGGELLWLGDHHG